MPRDASQIEQVGPHPGQPPLLTLQGGESAAHPWVKVIEGHERGRASEKACQGCSELVGHTGEQLPSQPVALGEQKHLLSCLSELKRCGSRTRLLEVQAFQVLVSGSQVGTECLGAQLGGSTSSAEAADQPSGAEKHQEVDNVGLIRNRQGVERENEEPIDEKEARGGGKQRWDEAAEDGQDGDNGEVDEDVVARDAATEG